MLAINLNRSEVVKIINSDNFCLLRAILVGKAFADKEKNANLLTRLYFLPIAKKLQVMEKKMLLMFRF